MIVHSSVQFSCSIVSNSLRPHESQHARPLCPSPTPGVYSNSYPLSQWCHPALSSSVVPFSSCPQSLPASGSFPMSQLFTWGGQSIGVSALASVLPMNTQDSSPVVHKGISNRKWGGREYVKKRQLNNTDKEIYHHQPCEGSLLGPALGWWRVSKNKGRRKEKKRSSLKRGKQS